MWRPVRAASRDRDPPAALQVSVHQLHGLRPPLHDRRSLPYDRKQTTMAGFDVRRMPPRVPDPMDRRYTPSPSLARIAAPGQPPGRARPTPDGRRDRRTAAMIRQGRILAVKGWGFHLVCDPRNSGHRQVKGHQEEDSQPLALMARDSKPSRNSPTSAGRTPGNPIPSRPSSSSRRRKISRDRPASRRGGIHAGTPRSMRFSSKTSAHCGHKLK
jgi:hypothetical protein